MQRQWLTRRSVLAGTVGISIAGLAGCLSDDDNGDNSDHTDRTTVVEASAPESSIAESMRVRRHEEGTYYDNLEIFIDPDSHMAMGSLTKDFIHIMSSRSYETERETDDGQEERVVLSVGLPDEFVDDPPLELTLFPTVDPDTLFDQEPYFGELPEGFTFGAGFDTIEAFDLTVDTADGIIDLEPRHEIPVLQGDHEPRPED